MAGRIIRRAHRGRGGPKNNVWVPAVLDQSLSAGAVLNLFLIAGADWDSSTAGLERATLMTVRGYINVNFTWASLAAPRVWMAIVVVHKDVTFTDLSQPAFYTEDILWTGGAKTVFTTTQSSQQQTDHSWDVNVRTKRRITDQQIVGLVIFAEQVQIELQAVLRSLVRRSS